MENITNQSIATHRGSAPLPRGRGGGESLLPASTHRGSAPPLRGGGGEVGGRESLQLMVAVLLVIFGILLIATAFICPPLGVIDPSVLTAYGETLTFAGSLIGLDYHYRFKQKSTDDEDAENNQAYEA